MGGYAGIVFCTIFMILINRSSSDTPCNGRDVMHNKCSINEACSITDEINNIAVCKCKPGFEKKASDGPCLSVSGINPDSNSSDLPFTTEIPPVSPYSVTAIVVGVFLPLVVFAILGLIYIARKYQWINKLHRMGVRRYEEVPIGQGDEDDDDPPLQ